MFFKKVFSARVAASSSRQLMCHFFSRGDQGPPVLVPWQDAPQPWDEASDSMVRSGSVANSVLTLPHVIKWRTDSCSLSPSSPFPVILPVFSFLLTGH